MSDLINNLYFEIMSLILDKFLGIWEQTIVYVISLIIIKIIKSLNKMNTCKTNYSEYNFKSS